MRIKEEISTNIKSLRANKDEGDQKWQMSSIEETAGCKIVYLHAALCESLRLYPLVPFVQRECLQHDTLPSGHRVKPKAKVMISAYAMARMKWIWGEDCHEFKPEMWINFDKGEIKMRHEPSNKYFTFSSGPRVCPGKEMAFTIMKAVTATIVYNYHVQVVESGCPVIPTASAILHKKHGLIARVKSTTLRT